MDSRVALWKEIFILLTPLCQNFKTEISKPHVHVED